MLSSIVSISVLCEFACQHHTIGVSANLVTEYIVVSGIINFGNLNLNNVELFPLLLQICLL